jgi:amino acid transporter
MVGPEFISMAAGEAENPRRLMGKAFASFVWRLMFFFIGGALCVGIVIPSNDQMLADVISGDRDGSGTGAACVNQSHPPWLRPKLTKSDLHTLSPW